MSSFTDRDYVHPFKYATVDSKGPHEVSSYGINKRELFAAMAMQGMLSSAVLLDDENEYAHHSVNMADALIAELEKKG